MYMHYICLYYLYFYSVRHLYLEYSFSVLVVCLLSGDYMYSSCRCDCGIYSAGYPEYS